MPGLGITYGRGGATSNLQDLQNADCILIEGSNMAEAHPVGFRHPMIAKEKNGAKLDVRYPQCVVPDTFRDLPGTEVAVTVEGRLASVGHFEADRIMAKCPSKYDMSERAAKGERAPHAGRGPAAGAVPD